MVETVDIYPTLSELAGLESVVGLDGQSFARALDETTVALRDHVIHVFPRGKLLGRAIRTERYRLVEWKPFGKEEAEAEWELYDYQEDPLEAKNIYQQADPATVLALKHRLRTHPQPLPQIK